MRGLSRTRRLPCPPGRKSRPGARRSTARGSGRSDPAARPELVEGLRPAGEDRLEMRFSRLAGRQEDLDLPEPGLFQEPVERVLIEAEPDIGVELPGPLK